MKHVAPVRKALGLKTFFNMLGPLVNPSQPKNQMVGVFNLELARMYQYLFQQSDKNYTIVHTLEGYDEISLTGPFKLIQNKKEQIIEPTTLGFKKVMATELASSGDVKGTANMFLEVLKGEAPQAKMEVVLCNAAFAIQTMDTGLSFEDALEQAKESLLGGKALKVFKMLIA